MHRNNLARLARTVLLAAAAALLASGVAIAQDDSEFNPWAPGSQWLAVRAGYAKSTVDGTGNGGPGWGFAYSRMLSGLKLYRWTLFRHYSLGASVHHDLVGHMASAAEIDVPFVVELVRHYEWNTALRPYVGLGAGGYYRKTYRTGDDLRDVSLGYFLSLGGNFPVAERNLFGVDVRMSRLDAHNDPVNPVFGRGSVTAENGGFKEETGTHWGAKLSWSFAY